jgi:PPOX class probable F420-dependent enzyme
VTFDESALEVIDGPHMAVLSTTNSDGQPQSSVIFVKRDGDSVIFSTIKGRRKVGNMERDPRVSLLLHSKDSARYVEIRGTVEIADDPEKKLLNEMYQLYMGGITPPPEPESERLITRITPTRVRSWPPL